jgi:putative oxidoreductase
MTVAVEVIGGVAALFGFKTRLSAIVLALFTLAAALVFHRDMSNEQVLGHFLSNLAIAAGLFEMALVGAVAYSVDSMLRGGGVRVISKSA